jgi:hypothetical protein
MLLQRQDRRFSGVGEKVRSRKNLPCADAVDAPDYGLQGEWHMMGDQESRVQRLMARLRHEDSVVRIHAGILLGDMGRAARKAIPSLLDLLNCGSVQDRKMAVVTLGHIGAAQAILALRHALRDTDPVVRRLAGSALARIETDLCGKAA